MTVSCIKKSRFKDLNNVGLLIAFMFGMVFHKYGVGYFTSSLYRSNEVIENYNYVNALADKTSKNLFDKWVKQTPVIKFIDLKRGLGGKEDHIGLSLIVENGLIPTSSPSTTHPSTANNKKNKQEIRAFYTNNLPWANGLKSKKGWIFNNVCPLECHGTNAEILWGSKESLCPMMFRPEM